MKYDGLIDKECEEKIKEYIKEDFFKEINEKANLCDLNNDEETIMQNIFDYIFLYGANYRRNRLNAEIQKFIGFMEAYKNNEEMDFSKEGKEIPSIAEENLLYICNGYHIYGKPTKIVNDPRITATNGFYSRGSYIGTDHKIYLSKKTMNTRALPVDGEDRIEVDYNPMIAQTVFETFDVPVAEYNLLKDENNVLNLVLTKNFLNEKQELIHFSDLYYIGENLETFSSRISLMENNILMRYKKQLGEEKTEKLLDKLKLQYCKQEFLKQLIGPMDSNLSNTALVLTNEDNSEVPEIDLSPAFDLDLSFNIAEHLFRDNNMDLITSSNGEKGSLHGLVNEFKNIKGFKEFLYEVNEKINSEDLSNKIVQDTYNRTNMSYFKEHANGYTIFLNKRFREFQKIYDRLVKKEIGENDNEIVLE